MRLSIIIPALNEAKTIGATLSKLAKCREKGHEIVLVDGGSTDETVAIAKKYADKVVTSKRGRAEQMNRGAKVATGQVFWFLHADTLPPADVEQIIMQGLRVTGRRWGRFDVQLSGKRKRLKLVGKMMNMRSKLTGIATGDQGIFVTRALFIKVGGFPDIPLMEDIEITKKLKRVSRPLCLKDQLETSSRRWEEQGINKTIVKMWWLRLAYFLGANPAKLKEKYPPSTSSSS